MSRDHIFKNIRLKTNTVNEIVIVNSVFWDIMQCTAVKVT
jgi:hypothetical protein